MPDKPIGVMESNEQTRQAATFAIWPVIPFGLAGAAMFNLSPVYLATQAARFELDDRQLGWLMSIEIAGIAIAAVVILALWRRLDLHWIALTGACFIFLGNLLSQFTDTVTVFFVTRFVTGLFGDGFAYAATVATLGRHPNPVRAFATLSFTNMCVTAVGLALLPGIAAASRGIVVLGAFSLFALIAMAVWHRFPRLGPDVASGDARRGSLFQPSHVLGLTGLMAFTTNLGAVWGYVERIGQHIGLAVLTVGGLLSLSILFQAIGSLIAMLGSRRITPAMALGVVALCQLAAVALLATADTAWHFGAALCIWGASWNFGLANLLGMLANLRGSGAALASAPGVEAVGVAMGPLLVGALLSQGIQAAVTSVAAGAVLLTMMCFAVLRQLGTRPCGCSVRY